MPINWKQRIIQARLDTLKSQDTFEDWYKTIPKEYNDTTNYNLRRAYELAPLKELEAWRKDPENNHLHTGYWNENGEYEFMKSPNHPTIKYELDWYNNAKDFQSQ